MEVDVSAVCHAAWEGSRKDDELREAVLQACRNAYGPRGAAAARAVLGVLQTHAERQQTWLRQAARAGRSPQMSL